MNILNRRSALSVFAFFGLGLFRRLMPNQSMPEVPPGCSPDSPVRFDPKLGGYRRADDPQPIPDWYDTVDPVMVDRIVPYPDDPSCCEIERVSWQEEFNRLRSRAKLFEQQNGYRHMICEQSTGLRITIEEYQVILRSHGIMVI